MPKAPFWGDLPPPKITRGNSTKQERDTLSRGGNGLSVDTTMDTTMKGDRLSTQSQSKPNRSSTLTDAPTLSTLSPFASPIALEFRGDGLAPRPPSFPYDPLLQIRNDEFYERRRRRESRNREQNAQEKSTGPPPAAPEVPSAPPVSYRAPHGGNTRQVVSQDVARSRSTKQPEVGSNGGPPEGYLRSQRKDSYPADVGQLRRPSNGRAAKDDEYKPTPRRGDSTRSQARKTSLSEAEGQRQREWAPDRSPLQRLELTLDGITKEEKRARVEEAELLAREARVGRGVAKANSNSVRFQNQAAGKTSDAGIDREPEAGLIRGISNSQREQLQRSGTIERKRLVESKAPQLDSGFEYQPGPDVISTKSRAKDASPPQRETSTPDKSQMPVASGALPATSVRRSTSNKLKKQPPGDPLYQKKKEAETRSRPAEPPHLSIRDQLPTRKEEQLQNRGPIPARIVTLRGRPLNTDKELPPPPPPSQGSKSPPEVLADSLSDDDLDLTPPVRRGTTRKIEQLTGQKVPIEGQASASGEEIDTKPFRKGTMSKIEWMMGQKQVPGKETDGKPVRRGTLTKQRPKGAVPKSPPQNAGSVGTGEGVKTELVTVNGVKYEIPPPASRTDDPHHQPLGEDETSQGQRQHHLSDVLHRHEKSPGQRVYVPPSRLIEWKKGGVALLSGTSLDLETVEPAEVDKDKAWWEAGGTGKKRRNSTKQRKAEAYDGEYDDKSAPTRFKPPLFLKCGPLLRYCGMRRERLQSRSNRHAIMPEREIWRGSIMIVTQDSQSSYELSPTLRLFLQPIDLLPPPPDHVDFETGELAPEYVDPLAGLPKMGRDGRTLYIRPVDHLEEAKDLSREDSDEGLFEMHKSPPDGAADKKPTVQKPQYDGEKAGKYKEVRGFRLHAENGSTFWRFNIEIELRQKQQRIAYRINRGPATAFWVPAKDQAMNIMFYSCNGFSHDIDPDKFSGPDPMWRDVLNTHQTQPFHVMLGGGDQIYNDPVMDETVLFKEWLDMKDPVHKARVPFTAELQQELEEFYLNRYAMWFSQGLFSVATSQIPMINIFDDHDIIDGFGSYPHHYMKSPVMSGLGAVAFKYYMLFQHQSSIDEGEDTEPSWILGTQPGPYIPELSRSVFAMLGRSVAFLGLDCRTERMNDEIVSTETYHKVFDRLERDIVKGQTKHLIVMVGVPMAYPRMVWLENILTSRAMIPLKALGRAGLLGKGLLNKFDGGVEVLDDLDDHWTARHHKSERNWLLQELQDLAAEKSVRVTLLGGDVHLGAVGQFYSNPKLAVPKDKDHRYMPNIISSAIVNTPPPTRLADILNKRNKVHHLDDVTDEDMIPLFTHDVNGKPRNNKRLLNRRNWCSIRSYDPSSSPPLTPQSEGPATPPSRGGLFRRLSNRGPSYRPDVAAPTAAPPLSNSGFFSRRLSVSRRDSVDSQRLGKLTRSLSLTRKDVMPGIFRRSRKRRDEINGYGSETDDDGYYTDDRPQLRGGSGGPESRDSYFPPMPPPTSRAAEEPVGGAASTSSSGAKPQQGFVRTQFHRTPTGLSEKQIRKGGASVDINLEGGLDICLHMEVNQKDPAGITMPYRLLVPALFHEDKPHVPAPPKQEGGLKRFVSLSKRKPKKEVEEFSEDDYSSIGEDRRAGAPAPAAAAAPTTQKR